MASENIKNKPYAQSVKAIFAHNKFSFAASLLGICLKSAALLGTARLMQMILDYIAGSQTYDLVYLLSFSVFCVACRALSAVIEYVYWTRFRVKALMQYREYTYKKILSKNVRAFQHESVANYLSALSNDLNQIKDNYIEAFPYLLELLLNFCGAAMMMLLYQPRLAAIAFILSTLPIAISYSRLKEVGRQEKNLSLAQAKFVRFLSEMLNGFPTIKSLKAEKEVADNLFVQNADAASVFGKREQIEISVAQAAALSGLMVQIGVFFAGAFMAQTNAAISVGVVAVFIQLTKNIIQIAVSFPELIARMNAAKGLMAKNESTLEYHQTDGERVTLSCEQMLEIRHLSAKVCGEEDIIKDLSLLVPARSCYAIVGESGSGKTTLLNLVSGILKNYSGEIRYDGKEIRAVSEDSLFDLILFLQQDVFIFNASIEDNITVFGKYSGKNLAEAIEQAGLQEVIQKKGLDFLCGENGNFLSGGEKQRIAIARSILKGTSVLLFDEATSALDVQTTRKIVNTIQNMNATTRIVVTHDLFPDLMSRYDQIILLKNGTVADIGSYAELIARHQNLKL